MKERPKNILFWIAALFVPWQLIYTYVECDNVNMIFSRYYVKNGKAKKDQTRFSLNDVIKIGFTRELGLPPQEEILSSAYGTYISQEICFILKNGDIVSFNARPYSKKQCRLIVNTCNCVKGKILCNTLRL